MATFWRKGIDFNVQVFVLRIDSFITFVFTAHVAGTHVVRVRVSRNFTRRASATFSFGTQY